MYVRLVALVAGLLLPAAAVLAQAKRPDWDQQKAVALVKQLIAQEERGDFGWDKIAWQTDPEKAVALARQEQKPIFLFFFLKKNVGPAAAPC